MHKHTISMERYAYASRLRRCSASLKTALSTVVVLLCLCFDCTAVSLWIILSAGVVTVVLGRVRLGDYLRCLGIPLIFLICAGIGLFLTVGDVRQVMQVTLRALGAVSVLYFLILSTPVSGILSVLRRCHMPKLLTELMYLMYRYIFLLTDVCRTMYTAACGRLGCKDYRTALRTFGGVGSNLLVVSMKRADDCYHAMESRCYMGELRFLEKEEKGRAWEWACAALYIGSIAAVRRFCG